MAVDVVFVIDPVGYQRAFRSWEGDVGVYLKKKTVETRALAMLGAPRPGLVATNRTGINYATGELAAGHVASYGHTTAGDLESAVVAVPEHALMVHGGTKPHVIKPKTAPRLVFFWHKKGRIVGLPKVNHPGSAANPWLAKALEAAFKL